MGRLTKTTDAFGERVYTFNDDFQPATEAWNGLLVNTLTRSYDPQNGRGDGFNLLTGYDITYGFTSQGRFESVSFDNGSTQHTATYAYTPDSNLIAGYTLGDFDREIDYESNRNLVDTITNTYDVTTVSAFDYTNDAAGRRTARTDSGSVFSSTQVNSFGYNGRNEITSTTMRNGNSTYSFDQIGNRIEASLPDAAQPIDYVSNSLNQYTDIEGDTPAFDDDGNLTSDGNGKWFSWNGENRMIEVRDYDQTPADGAVRTRFVYDSQGRRVQKLNESYDLATDNWTATSDHRYFYDGWNLLFEIDTLSTDPTRYYVWGLDLSQSMQGAGGVGGLLFTKAGAQTHAVSYDANGNISEYIDLADGSVDAHLEYDAFGRTIASTGAAPATFGFSTKYQDEETGYYYYGFRYYDPETGRWPNRDPLGEQGGLNLFGFVNNYAVNTWDYLGLVKVKKDLQKKKDRMTFEGDLIWGWTFEPEDPDEKEAKTKLNKTGCECSVTKKPELTFTIVIWVVDNGKQNWTLDVTDTDGKRYPDSSVHVTRGLARAALEHENKRFDAWSKALKSYYEREYENKVESLTADTCEELDKKIKQTLIDANAGWGGSKEGQELLRELISIGVNGATSAPTIKDTWSGGVKVVYDLD